MKKKRLKTALKTQRTIVGRAEDIVKWLGQETRSPDPDEGWQLSNAEG